MDTISYIIGTNIGSGYYKNIKEDTIANLNMKMIADGFNDVFNGKDNLFSDEVKQKLLSEFSREIQAKQQEIAMQQAGPNRQMGQAFLESNKNKEGVVALPSGLQYKVIKQGKGPKPKATDIVTVHYKGSLIDGTEFESSYANNQPFSTPLNRVIPGWTEGLMLMSTGSIFEFYIPADLAYGDRGSEKIAPGSTLIFQVELLSVKAE